jgi:hypothetical protein
VGGKPRIAKRSPGADFLQNLLACCRDMSDECRDRGDHRARRLKMKTFTIENETNNITLHSSAKEAEAVPDSERFSNEGALAKLATGWPAARLVEIWNSLTGETPVRKFKDRATAVARIWKALQSLEETSPVSEGAEQVPEVSLVAELPVRPTLPESETGEAAEPAAVIADSTEPAPATPVAPQTPDGGPGVAPTRNRATRAKKAPVAASAKDAGAPREGSKTSQVIAMLKHEGGVTLEEIMTAMSWQKHTTRAMLSAGGSLTKKHGLVVSSEKVGDHRKYSIKA